MARVVARVRIDPVAERWRGVRGDLVLVFANWLLRWPGHRFRLLVLRSLMGVEVGESTSVERGVRLLTRGGVAIGANTNINRDVVLDGRGGLRIGAGVNLSPEVLLLTAEHDVTSPEFEGVAAPVVVGDRCWIATRAIVLPGTTVGTGAVVGAGTVVRGVVTADTVVVSAPARQVHIRPGEAQTTLAAYRRWLH
ncbi:MAG: acyltransferase [Actinomycetota bacterium]|nr:acyltransferase [Actinomycetota bacterium]